MSKSGENIRIVKTIKNKKFEDNNIKKYERMFGLLVTVLGVVLLVGFWSIIFGVIEFFKELKEKNKDSV